MPKPPKHSRRLPRGIAEQLAGLACVPDGERELFCDWLRDSVAEVWRQTRRASSKPGPALIKAAATAQTLNEAVCSLNKVDRNWIDRLVAHDPRLYYEKRLLGSTEPFQPDELHQTVFLLAYLFNTAIGKSPPFLAGTATLPAKRGPKKGAVKDPTFYKFVWGLLTSTDEAGGKTLSLDKNKNQKEGTLVRALDILRRYLPSGVIPDDLSPHRATLQRIRTEHSKARRRWLESLTE
jgi:hypothetical protein